MYPRSHLSIAEALIDSKAYIWFATHFRELAQIMKERSGVINMHLAVDVSQDDRMIMLHKIAEGFEKERHYGLAMARVVDLPRHVLEVAERVSKSLEAQAIAKKHSSGAFTILKKRKLVLGLREALHQAKDSPMEGKVLINWLRKLQEEFVQRMDQIENEDEGGDDDSMEDADHCSLDEEI